MGKTNKMLSFLFSNKLTLFLLIGFAVSMGYATFLENDFGTPAARDLIYGSWWFEVLMLLLGANFIGNIFRYKLLQRRKWAILLFHVAFIVILLGALITRYFGSEGLVRIREGNQTEILISQKQFLNINISNPSDTLFFEKPVSGSVLSPIMFDIDLESYNQAINFKTIDFIPDAIEIIQESESNSTILKLVTTGIGGRTDYNLKSGETFKTGSLDISFNNKINGAINIRETEAGIQLSSPVNLEFIEMASQQVGVVQADSVVDLKVGTLYTNDFMSFVIGAVLHNSKVGYVSTDDKEVAKTSPDVLIVEVSSADDKEEVVLNSSEGVISKPVRIKMGDNTITMSYGPKAIELPFALYLRDFELVRYPGSTSPSSYASEVTVIDGETSFPYRIYMNNVLDYRGYRFFQASYDLDERGTVLSASKDWLGTRITYLGYLLMGIGMMMALFSKGSRFTEISGKLKRLNQMAGILLFLLVPISSEAKNESPSNASSTRVFGGMDVLRSQYIDQKHSEEFGKLLVQDLDGRIKPVNTLASEFIRKVRRKLDFTYEENDQSIKMNSDQVFLSIHTDPVAWQYIPFIKVDLKKGREIYNQLQIQPQEFLTFNDFLDENGDYRLSLMIDMANRKKTSPKKCIRSGSNKSG